MISILTAHCKSQYEAKHKSIIITINPCTVKQHQGNLTSQRHYTSNDRCPQETFTLLNGLKYAYGSFMEQGQSYFSANISNTSLLSLLG